MVLNKWITREEFDRVMNKIKEALFRHKSRIEILENKVALLEAKVESLDNENNPWKMPFD